MTVAYSRGAKLKAWVRCRPCPNLGLAVFFMGANSELRLVGSEEAVIQK